MPLKALVTTPLIVVTTLEISGDTRILDTNFIAYYSGLIIGNS